MSSLFLSHSSRDKATAVRLREALLGLGFAEVFIDTHSIQVGQRWEAVLYERLRACRAMVLLLSPRFLESKWCFAEVTHARALGRPILPVRMEACEVPPFLQEYQVQDFADVSPAMLERLREGLARADVRPGDRPEWDRRRSPYPGLASFDVEDAGVYFGRDGDIQAGLDRLHDMALFGGDTSLLILGASGAGKSSLLRAGIANRLRRRPQHWCVVGPMRPREEPFTQLARTVQLALSRGGGAPVPEAQVKEALMDEAAPLRALRALRPPESPDARFALVVDQLEELLTAGEEEREDFLIWFARALALPNHPLLLLGSLRSDHLAKFERMVPFAIPARGYLSLQPIPVEQLRLAISRPAEVAGVAFEDGLADTILEDVRGRQALPLLAFTLRELWDRRAPGAHLTRHSYAHDIGGVEGAIRRAAEAATGGARKEEHWRDLRRVLLRMVQVEPDGRVLRRRMRTSEVPARVQAPIMALVQARLLVVDGDFVEPAHEALFSAWEKLDSAVTEARDALVVRTELEADAARWQREGGRPEYLWPRVRLERATKLLGTAELELDSVGGKFTEASWEKVRREEELEAGRKRRETLFLRGVAVGAVVLLAVISTLGLRAWTQQQQAELREITTSALLEIRKDPQRALLLLQETVRRSAPERFQEFMEAWGREPCRLVLRGHGDALTSAVFSPDGTLILTASNDATARVWDVATGKPLATLQGHELLVQAASFSPDGTRVVTASWDTTARVWDVATGKPLATLQGHTRSVVAASFSLDGTRIVTASDDTTARVWDAATGKPLATLQGHTRGVVAASFSLDGTRILTASEDTTARVWDAATGQPLATLLGHQGVVRAASFNPEGTRIVTAADDTTARVWDAATGQSLATLLGHGGMVRAASFSPDGTRIVTASYSTTDTTARVWDTATGKPLATLQGHELPVQVASFSPDGTRIVTASEDTTARVWDAATGKPLALLQGHARNVVAASFSPDGNRVVTASWDYTARVWDTAKGKPLATLKGHELPVQVASFSRDGTRVVTASEDTTARVWEAATGKPLAILKGHQGMVRTASFSPDGTRVVTASEDTTARVWEAATGKHLVSLESHTGVVQAASFNLDGTRVVTASDDTTARVWDAATGKHLVSLQGHTGEVVAASFSRDGTRIVTASEDTTARVWDAATGKHLATLLGHQGGVLAASFNPEGTRIVTSSDDNTARVWDAVTGNHLVTLQGDELLVLAPSFSPDGTRIVTSGVSARVWEAATGQQLSLLGGHQELIRTASFSPDGTRIVTASVDTTARVWDAATGKLLAIFESHTGEVLAASFSTDSTRIVTASADGTARVWPNWRWDLTAFSTFDVGRELSCEERRDFLHEQTECPGAAPNGDSRPLAR